MATLSRYGRPPCLSESEDQLISLLVGYKACFILDHTMC